MQKKLNISFFLLFVFFGCENGTSFKKEYIDPHIIFSSRRWWNYDIFLSNIYDNQTTQLTKNRWIDFNPSVSHDSKKLAFISDRDGNREIYVFDLV